LALTIAASEGWLSCLLVSSEEEGPAPVAADAAIVAPELLVGS